MISATLDSIQAQTCQDFEVIVVDDGSTDRTVQVIAERYPKIRILQQANQGPGTARNHGAEFASGEYITFLDSDDLWFPWTLETYAQAIIENENPSFIAGKPFVFSDIEELNDVSVSDITVDKFTDYLASSDQWRWFGVSSFVISRNAFLEVGGFLNGRVNSEDAELALRLGEASGFIQVLRPHTFGYRSHTGNVTNDHAKSKMGLQKLLDNESTGKFPGGDDRKSERWRIISRHVRPYSIMAARDGDWHCAASLYRQTIPWHLQSLRWKYLIWLPVLTVVGVIKRLASKQMSPNA
jgi:glycosyltransferase involved in cell wall biosynthesis